MSVETLQCRYCGASCSENLSFCEHCGKRLKGAGLAVRLVPLTVLPAQMHNLLTTLTTVDQLLHVIQQQLLLLVNFSTLDAPTRSSLGRLSMLVDTLLSGSDRDGDGSIDPIPGEAAVAQLYGYMQQVGAIRLG